MLPADTRTVLTITTRWDLPYMWEVPASNTVPHC